jgi:hypothetical protein
MIMDVSAELDRHSPIVKRVLRIRESLQRHDAPVSLSTGSTESEVRNSRRQDWNKLEMAPVCGILLTCSAKSRLE